MPAPHRARHADPTRLTDGDPEPVRSKSIALAKKSFGCADSRLAATGWWLDDWSLVDVYLDWAMSVASNAVFDFAPYSPTCRACGPG